MRKVLLFLCVFVPLCWLSSSARAEGPVAGNYCVSCHASADARLARAADWRGSPAVTPSVCPGLRATDEQLYYVERELLAVHRLDPDAAALPSLYEAYGALLDAPRDSADAFAAQAQVLAYKTGKAYAAANQAVESGKRGRVLIAAVLITAFLLFAFGWGLQNTLRGQPARGLPAAWRPGARTVGVLGVVAVLFALPLFRAPPPVETVSSIEEQAVQAELDKSSRAGAVAERSLARAAMLGEIAAVWAQTDRARGEEILNEALAAESAARAEADALWGRGQAGREAGVGSASGQDKAAQVSEELLSVRSRAWALRLIASEWAKVDAARARELLAQAEGIARANPTVYGQMDLAAVAATAARLDPSRAVPAVAPLPPRAADSGDPLATALALHRAKDYAGAWEAAGRVSDEWERSKAQAAIAEAWGNPEAASEITLAPLRERAARKITGAARDAQAAAPVAEALAEIDKLATEAEKADALRALAVRSGDPAVFERALHMAAAARVRGDALAAARASLALARDLAQNGGAQAHIAAALSQAHDLTVKISVKYK